jgi:hypothetical protein
MCVDLGGRRIIKKKKPILILIFRHTWLVSTNRVESTLLAVRSEPSTVLLFRSSAKFRFTDSDTDCLPASVLCWMGPSLVVCYSVHWLFVAVYVGCLLQFTLVVCYSLHSLFVTVYAGCCSLHSLLQFTFVVCCSLLWLFVAVYVGCLLQFTLGVWLFCCSLRWLFGCFVAVYVGCLLQFRLHWLFVTVYVGCLLQFTLVVCCSLRWLFVTVYVGCFVAVYVGCLLQFTLHWLFVTVYIGCLLQFTLHFHKLHSIKTKVVCPILYFLSHSVFCCRRFVTYCNQTGDLHSQCIPMFMPALPVPFTQRHVGLYGCTIAIVCTAYANSYPFPYLNDVTFYFVYLCSVYAAPLSGNSLRVLR